MFLDVLFVFGVFVCVWMCARLLMCCYCRHYLFKKFFSSEFWKNGFRLEWNERAGKQSLTTVVDCMRRNKAIYDGKHWGGNMQMIKNIRNGKWWWQEGKRKLNHLNKKWNSHFLLFSVFFFFVVVVSCSHFIIFHSIDMSRPWTFFRCLVYHIAEFLFI